jgi:hypothetical protein
MVFYGFENGFFSIFCSLQLGPSAPRRCGSYQRGRVRSRYSVRNLSAAHPQNPRRLRRWDASAARPLSPPKTRAAPPVYPARGAGTPATIACDRSKALTLLMKKVLKNFFCFLFLCFINSFYDVL